MPVSASVDSTQRCPVGQSRAVVHSLWHRLKAHTSGLLQSVSIKQPSGWVPGAASSPPQDAKPAAMTSTTMKHVAVENGVFKVPSKRKHVSRHFPRFQLQGSLGGVFLRVQIFALPLVLLGAAFCPPALGRRLVEELLSRSLHFLSRAGGTG